MAHLSCLLFVGRGWDRVIVAAHDKASGGRWWLSVRREFSCQPPARDVENIMKFHQPLSPVFRFTFYALWLLPADPFSPLLISTPFPSRRKGSIRWSAALRSLNLMAPSSSLLLMRNSPNASAAPSRVRIRGTLPISGPSPSFSRSNGND